MLYLRNVTPDEQWLEDPTTGIRRKIEPGGLARVTEEMAARALAAGSDRWQRVEPIRL